MGERLTSVHTDAAPKAIGPYSQAMVGAGLIFVSGQIPIDPHTGEMVAGSFADRVERVLANVDAILAGAGSGRDRVAKVTVFITDMARFSELNEIYARFFGEHRPARAVIQVAALPRNTDVEIEAVAIA